MNRNKENIALFKELKCCVIIPTYNNESSVAQVISDVKLYCDDIIVVLDGPTDNTATLVRQIDDISIVDYGKNRGKGYALRQGFKQALSQGYEYAITLDSDGQHYAKDLPKFLEALKTKKRSVIIGSRELDQDNVPRKSSFGNNFSNFWFKLETGVDMPDTQSGYRLYPIDALKNTTLLTNKFEFEIEILVRSSWAGIEVEHIPVGVYYPNPEERITHFRPFKDFTRISILNTVLVFLAILYYIPKRQVLRIKKKGLIKTIKEDLIGNKQSPLELAKAVGFGFFMGIFPIWGYQLMVGIPTAHFLKINKTIFIIAANISIPPMIPFILYASYISGGALLGKSYSTEIPKDIQAMLDPAHLVQYLIGAVILAIAMGLAGGIITYIISSVYKKIKING